MNRITDYIENIRQQHPEKILAHESEKTYTYRRIQRHGELLAHALKQTGLRQGDFVCISLSNTHYFPVAFFGVLNAGFVPVLINPETPPEKMGFILNDVNAVVFITHSHIFDSICRTSHGLSHVFLDKDGSPADRDRVSIVSFEYRGLARSWGTQETGMNECGRAESADTEAIALCIYTSGTTGQPKGVLLSYKNIEYAVNVMVSFLHLTGRDCSLVSIPMTHLAGLLQLLAYIKCGAGLILGENPVFVGPLLKQVREKQVTTLHVVPPLFSLWVEKHADLVKTYCSNLRFIEFSSARLPSKLIASLLRILPGVDIYNTYGLTESPRATYYKVQTQNALSMGLPNPGVDISIRDPNGDLCERYETGEIHISGPNVSPGYLKRVTEPVFQRVFKTGDLGYKDRDGLLFFKGRVDDMLKIGAQKVFPIEIEELVLSMAGVREAEAYGVDDPVYGKTIHLKVVRSQSGPTENDIIRLCRRKMERHKVATRIIFCDAIARSNVGKSTKTLLRA